MSPEVFTVETEKAQEFIEEVIRANRKLERKVCIDTNLNA